MDDWSLVGIINTIFHNWICMPVIKSINYNYVIIHVCAFGITHFRGMIMYLSIYLITSI